MEKGKEYCSYVSRLGSRLIDYTGRQIVVVFNKRGETSDEIHVNLLIIFIFEILWYIKIRFVNKILREILTPCVLRGRTPRRSQITMAEAESSG